MAEESCEISIAIKLSFTGETPCLKAFSTNEIRSSGAIFILSSSAMVLLKVTLQFGLRRSFIRFTYSFKNSTSFDAAIKLS